MGYICLSGVCLLALRCSGDPRPDAASHAADRGVRAPFTVGCGTTERDEGVGDERTIRVVLVHEGMLVNGDVGDLPAGDGELEEVPQPLDYEQFIRQRRSELLRYVRRVADSPEEGEDALQDALVDAYREWQAVSVMERPLGWVLRVTSHKLYLLRRGRRRPLHTSPASVRETVADPSEALVKSSELWDAVRQLSPRLRQVVTIRHTFDLSVGEIAVCLDLKESAVRGHLARAYAQLRDLLPPVQQDDVP